MSAGRKNNVAKKDYNTPPKYVAPIMDFFNGKLELDPCSNSTSLIPAKRKIILPEDGLKHEWCAYNSIFINPPYGRDSDSKTSIYSWIKKSWETWNLMLIPKPDHLFLIPVATNTKHFKEIIFKYFTGICFLEDTRLKFYNNGKEDPKGAPMACCLVYLGQDYPKFKKVFSKYGKCFNICEI